MGFVSDFKYLQPFEFSGLVQLLNLEFLGLSELLLRLEFRLAVYDIENLSLEVVVPERKGLLLELREVSLDLGGVKCIQDSE